MQSSLLAELAKVHHHHDDDGNINNNEPIIKLKPVKTRDGSLPITTPAEKSSMDTDEDIYLDLYLDGAIESWLEEIKDHTFATELLNVTYHEMVVINRCCVLIQEDKVLESLQQLYDLKQQQEQQERQQDNIATPLLSSVEVTSLTEALRGLEVRLNATIASMRAKTNGDTTFFIKPSSRSAKDVAFKSQKVQNIYRNLVWDGVGRGECCGDKSINKNTAEGDNYRAMCMLKAFLENLKYSDAFEFLSTLVLSERVLHDTTLLIQMKDVRYRVVGVDNDENNDKNNNTCNAALPLFNWSFAVRQWKEIAPDMEFRTFVFNWKANACSQYNHQLYSKRLHHNQAEYSEKIQDFLNNTLLPTLREAFKEDSTAHPTPGSVQDGCAVLDVGIDVDGKLWVIELNGFLDSADAALFNWSSADDVKVMKEGPWAMRVRDHVEEDVVLSYNPQVLAFMSTWKKGRAAGADE